MVDYVKPAIDMGKVSLKVNELSTMIEFYEHKIGLDVLNKDASSAILGVAEDGEELVELVQLDRKAEKNSASGFYHFAIVVPERSDLGDIIVRFIREQTPLTGASFHGYSEALYLDDPEGNGIEIYRDLPVEDWDIREDGQIVGVTTYMDTQGVVDAADLNNMPEKLPAGTVMGHVHLRVTELEETEAFYKEIMNFDLKFRFGPQALFLANGTYHHQVAANIWESAGASKPSGLDRGINFFEIKVEDLNVFTNHLDEKDYDYSKVDEDTVKVLDPNGITVHVLEK